MGATGPTKLLGSISAMNTFVENFPMSVLDLLHGPTYTSIFVFLTDVLLACGVDVKEIVNRVVQKIFGVKTQITDFINGGIEDIEQAILDMDIDDQSEFMKTMEMSVKVILMSLLTSIFSCSAAPFIQNKYMDGSKKAGSLQKTGASGIIIPITAIDMFGILANGPFSDVGKFYYEIEGKDVYYQKVKNTQVVSHEEDAVDVNKAKAYNKLGIVFGAGHEAYLSGVKDIKLDVFFKINQVAEGWAYFTHGQIPSSKKSDISEFTDNLRAYASKLEDGTKVTIVGSADLGTGSSDRNRYLAPARACIVGKYLTEYCKDKMVEFNADFSKVDINEIVGYCNLSDAHIKIDNYLSSLGIDTESLIHYDIYEDPELSRAAVVHSRLPNNEDCIMFRAENDLDEDISIVIDYVYPDGRNESLWASIIAGERESTVVPLTAVDELGRKGVITSIKINGISTSILTVDETCVYLNKGKSQEVIDFWVSKGNNSFDCIRELTDEEKEMDDLSDVVDAWDNIYCGKDKMIFEDAYEEVIEEYVYEQVFKKPRTMTRVNAVPKTIGDDSPDYIVNYEGILPHELYKTFDMNAFIWYSIHEGMTEIQYEYNKMMWDNRLPQRNKYGIIRKKPSDWNMWYNSKVTDFHTFEPVNPKAKEGFKPILQLEPFEGRKDYIRVQFPAQVYKSDKTELFNTTIYKFNWQYLESIKIFKPKVILYGMFDALVNNVMSLILDTNVNFTKTYTKNILSTAIKKYIEADDMETEDCYFSFSNEEFDTMLRDMFLARYSATYRGGEVNPAVTHDINDYLSKIDAVDFAAKQEGDVSHITKMINEVSVDASKEGSIDYGIDIDYDNGWWKKLLWAISMPIVESIFTPQVMLLIMLNFHIMGIVSLEDLFSNDQTAIVKLLINKIFSLVRSIILYIKDKIAEILLDLLIEKVLPLIAKMEAIKIMERIEAWIQVLKDALECIPIIMLDIDKYRKKNNAINNSLDEVNYADIDKTQSRPETTNNC